MAEGGSTGAERAAPILFREAQQFRIWTVWVPVAIVAVMVWWQFFEQVVRDNPQGSQPVPDWAAWVLAIVGGIGLPAFAVAVRLITQVHPDELTVRVFPFGTTHIPAADVKEAEVREFSPQREFGGWGVKTGPSGKAYSAYGNQGVQLWLTEDRRILIGSQRAEELAAALRETGIFVR